MVEYPNCLEAPAVFPDLVLGGIRRMAGGREDAQRDSLPCSDSPELRQPRAIGGLQKALVCGTEFERRRRFMAVYRLQNRCALTDEALTLGTRTEKAGTHTTL